MYRVNTVVVMFSMVAICGMLYAGGGFELYVNGALGLPMSPEVFSDYWKTSILNFGGGFGYSFSPVVSTNVYFDYGNFGFDGEKFAHDLGVGGMISVDGGNASVMTVTANIKAAVPTGVLRPYFCGGGGLYMLSIDDATVSGGGMVIPAEGDSENALGINFGAGFEFAVAKTVSIFLDGRYVLGFTEGESTGTLPIRLGAKVIL
ncbi:MAG: outer membrane beta-barrel protein [candidate division WOR-3 bacterium]|jgi:opacity protein-like surface antigen